MTTVPDRAPTFDEQTGIATWTDAEGITHRLHTDPEETEAFLSRAKQLMIGASDLRDVLDFMGLWVAAVLDAGMVPDDALNFLSHRLSRELEHLHKLAIDGDIWQHASEIVERARQEGEE